MARKIQLESMTGALGDFISDAIIVAEAEPVDLPGPRVLWCNRAFTEMTGYEPADIIGKTPRILQGENTCPQARANITAGLKAWRPVRQRILNYKKSGEEFWVELDIRPIANADGWFEYWVATQRDVTADVAMQAELADAKRSLELSIGAGQLGLWRWEVDKSRVEYGAEYFRLLGFRPEDFETETSVEWWEERLHPEDAPAVAKALSDHFEIGAPYDVTYRIRDAFGDWRWWRSRGEASPDRSLMIGVNVDVTETVSARLEAERANRLKSEFLANISHEIRTPLNGILGMAQLLSLGDVGEKERRFIERINASGDMLLSIVNDVIDLSKIETGNLALENEKFALVSVLRQACHAVEGAALKKDLYIRIETDLDNEVLVEGDANRLRQVIVNLLGNAVKFSDEGGVAVGARAVDGGYLIEVVDTGPGIEPEIIAHIFERFVQGDGSRTRKHGGAGLGLSIAKTLVEMMGGELGVTSEPGRGANFYFTLPAKASEGAAAPADAGGSGAVSTAAPGPVRRGPAQARRRSGPMRALLAEDNAVNQELVRSAFDDLEIDVVENGAAALQRLAGSHFDLLLLDIGMPVLPGDEVIRILRAPDGAASRIPILVLTADADPSRQRGFLELGADDCVTKPIDIDAVRNFIGLMNRRVEADASPVASIARVIQRSMNAKDLPARPERFACDLACSMETLDGDRADALITDLNEQGARLRLRRVMAPNEFLRLRPEGAPFSVLGRVVWAQDKEAGLQFVTMTGGAKSDAIRSFISSKLGDRTRAGAGPAPALQGAA